jgi:aerobic-type carbon monoxide dehydrogenase small subunit (CoxS/CutS family)
MRMSEHLVTLTVNGRTRTESVPARMTLADLLRERLDVTSPHLGCEHGVCGACTVLIDGRASRSCTTLAVQAEGAEVLTLEGLGGPDGLHPIQQAFTEHHAMQCGFCTPGFVMTLAEQFADGRCPPREEVLEAAGGCLCRCTGYVNIVKAIDALLGERGADDPGRERNGG